MAAVASPWGAPTAPSARSHPVSLTDIMAVEHNQQTLDVSKRDELQTILPHLTSEESKKLLDLCHNNVSEAVTKAFDLGEAGLAELLHPPKTREELDHDLAVALSLAGDEDQTVVTTKEEPVEQEDELPIKPTGIHRHDKDLSERYNAARLSSRAGVGNLMGTKISNKVYNSLSSKLIHRKTAKGMQVHGGSRVSKETRETSEGVLDQRTRKVIMSFINQEVLEKMGGVIATGKEASAYAAFGVGTPLPCDDLGHANGGGSSTSTTTPPTTRSPPQHLVVKFFRTTLSQFKNRADYVDGDSRYSSAKFSKIKTTDALKMWAAKEFRNLIRLHRAGVQCPKPLHVSGHTLVMTMISKDSNGVPAPQLREVQLSPQRLRHVFTHVAVNMRAMYQRAKLVHGDLSEFNMLYVGGKERPVVLIDVGQAVDLSHPKHIDYLRRDCRTVLDFFQRRCSKLKMSFGLLSVEELLMYIMSDEEEEEGEEEEDEKTFEEIDALALKRIKRRLKR